MTSQAGMTLVLQLRDEASKKLASVAGTIDGLDKRSSVLGNALSTALGVVGGNAISSAASALTGFLQGGIADARNAAVEMAQTEAVIKSTGGAAGVSAKQVADLATSLSAASGKSLFGDDAIQQSTNLLLTFTNLKGGVLDAATAISVDMAQALGGAPKDAAIQLGKALTDPTAGLTALTRVGVTFTDQQKATIKSMQDAGNVAGAQGVILQELNKEFGGSAQAAATADGGWAQMQDRLGELGESIGGAFLPVLQTAVGFMAGPGMAAIEALGASLAGGLTTATAWLSTTGVPALLAGWQALQPTLALVGAAFQVVAGVLMTAIPPAIAALTAALQTVAGFIGGNLQPVLVGVAAAIAAVVVPAFFAWAAAAATSAAATVVALAPVLLPIAAIGVAVGVLYATWQNNFGGIRDTLTAFWTGTGQPIFAELQTWLSSTLVAAAGALSHFWTGTLQPALSAVWAFIQGSVIPTLGTLASTAIPIVVSAAQSLAAFWRGTLQPALSAVWSFIQGSVIPILSSLATNAIPVVVAAAKGLATLWTTVLQPALSAVWSFIQGSVIPLLMALANVAIAAVKLAVTVLAGVWQNVLQPALSTVWSFIQNSLMPVFTRVASVISSTLQPVLSTVASVLNATVGPALSGAARFASTLSSSLGGISGVISTVIGWLNSLAKTLSNLPAHLPSWMKPGSPTPLEMGLRGISDAMRMVATQDVPRLARALDTLSAPTLGIGQPSFALAGGAALPSGVLASGGTSTAVGRAIGATTNNFNPTIIINQQPGEDADALARRVVDKLDARSRMKR